MGNSMNAPVKSLQTERGASGYLTIDLAALARNYKALSKRAPKSAVAAVVKADAYGLGAEQVAPEFYNAGCRLFFVAHLSEAIVLKPNLPRDAEIYVLNGLQPETEATCAALNIRPVLNSLEQLNNWATLCRIDGMKRKAAVQIDSGMSRLGFSQQELEILISNPEPLAAIELSFVMSHLACADEYDHPQNHAQLESFQKACLAFGDVQHCFANSGGLFLGTDFHHHIIRPGIALYGDAPTSELPLVVEPVMKLDVAVIQTRHVTAGTAIGYSAGYIAPRNMRLATIAAGYADGLPRTLSNKGAAWFNGKKLPIVGRVSMDSIIIDITELGENELKLGDLVEIIGENQTLKDVADAAGTIPYEILTSLGRRYRRIYINQMAQASVLLNLN